MLTAMPSIALAATALEPYETLIHEDGTLPKDIAILMSFGVSESDARRYVGDMYMDGQPRFEQLCGRTYLKDPSGPWVTDLGEAYILAAKAEWEQTGGGGGGHAIGGDDSGDDGGGGAGHSFDTGITFHSLYYAPDSIPRPTYLMAGTGNDAIQYYFMQKSNSEMMPRDVSVVLNGLSFTGLPEGNFSKLYIVDPSYGGTTNHQVRLYVCLFEYDSPTLTNYTDGINDGYLYKLAHNVTEYTGYKVFNYDFDGSLLTVDCNEPISLTEGNKSHSNTTKSISKGNLYAYLPYGGTGSGGGDDEPSGGGENPSGGGDDEPSAPTPPEIDPTEYTTYEGDNTDITVNVTFNNDGQTDLTPITTRLDRIYARLGDIGRDLLNFDQHVQSAFYSLENKLDGLFSSYLGSVKTWLEMIYNRVNDINRNIGNLDKSTDDKPDVTGIESLLRTIDTDIRGLELDPDIDLSKFDPLISDVGEILDNMDALMDDLTEWWAEMLGDLEDILDKLENLDIGVKNPFTRYGTPQRYTPNEIQLSTASDELDDAIRRLLAKFPFSTINNLTLIMTALVRPAQTPIFDLPVPNPVTPDEPYVVHVDLSDWDGVAAVGRVGITLWAIARVSRRTVNMWTREEGL